VKTPPLRVTLTAIYVMLIVAIVAGANTGILGAYVGFIHRIPFGDKLFHFLLIGGLAFFINWFLHCRSCQIRNCRILVGTAIVAVLSTTEEISQIWIPNRRFDIGDLAINLLGIFILGPLARHAGPPSSSRILARWKS
jgi:hypothetical protein